MNLHGRNRQKGVVRAVIAPSECTELLNYNEANPREEKSHESVRYSGADGNLDSDVLGSVCSDHK